MLKLDQLVNEEEAGKAIASIFELTAINGKINTVYGKKTYAGLYNTILNVMNHVKSHCLNLDQITGKREPIQWEVIEALNPTKKQLTELFFGEYPNYVDGSLPQEWLDSAAMETGLDYHYILSTTVWDCNQNLPVALCHEVAQRLALVRVQLAKY